MKGDGRKKKKKRLATVALNRSAGNGLWKAVIVAVLM